MNSLAPHYRGNGLEPLGTSPLHIHQTPNPFYVPAGIPPCTKDLRQLTQRMKQISFGVLSKGYLISIILGDRWSPPSVYTHYNKRKFDEAISKWRVHLHEFDHQLLNFEQLRQHPQYLLIKTTIETALRIIKNTDDPETHIQSVLAYLEFDPSKPDHCPDLFFEQTSHLRIERQL